MRSSSPWYPCNVLYFIGRRMKWMRIQMHTGLFPTLNTHIYHIVQQSWRDIIGLMLKRRSLWEVRIILSIICIEVNANPSWCLITKPKTEVYNEKSNKLSTEPCGAPTEKTRKQECRQLNCDPWCQKQIKGSMIPRVLFHF